MRDRDRDRAGTRLKRATRRTGPDRTGISQPSPEPHKNDSPSVLKRALKTRGQKGARDTDTETERRATQEPQEPSEALTHDTTSPCSHRA